MAFPSYCIRLHDKRKAIITGKICFKFKTEEQYAIQYFSLTHTVQSGNPEMCLDYISFSTKKNNFFPQKVKNPANSTPI